MNLKIALMLALLATSAQDKTYDLKLEAKPVKGHKAELTEASLMKMTMKMTGLPEPMAMGEETNFAAAQEVLAADADGNCELKWVFSKATQNKEGQNVALGFQGKTVLVKQVKGKSREFSYEGGGKIAEEDLPALKKAFMGGEEKPGQPSGAEMFAPKKPVKVGESWTLDLKVVVKGMFDAEMAEAVQFDKATSKFTLKSVESRNGSDFGKIDGTIELPLGAMGPMKLDTPVVLKMTLEADACIDGKLPDHVLKIKAEMKGKSAAAGPNGKIDIDLDMTMNGNLAARTAK